MHTIPEIGKKPKLFLYTKKEKIQKAQAATDL